MAFDLNKLKGLFVQSAPDANTQQPLASAVESGNKSDNIETAKSKELDTKIIDSLLKAIVDHNLPGEDYLEFMEALQALKNLPLDDAMKVQTVMATLSTKGLTIAKIKESSEYYKKILLNEQTQFVTELNSQIDKSIKTKQKTIADLQASIKQKTDQITQLTKEINEAQQNISSTEVLIKAAENKIKTAEENFNAAYNFVVNQINENVSKLK